MELELLFIGCQFTNILHIKNLLKNLILINTTKIYDEILALPLFPNIIKNSPR